MVPRGTDGVEFAAGTTATCMAQGFFDVFNSLLCHSVHRASGPLLVNFALGMDDE